MLMSIAGLTIYIQSTNSAKEWYLTIYINYAIALINKYNIHTAIVDIVDIFDEVNFNCFLPSSELM